LSLGREEGHMRINSNKLKLLIIVILLSSVFVGCTQAPQTISTYELKESAEISDREAALSNKETLKASFDRHYANGLYFEDLEDVKLDLTNAYIKQFESSIVDSFKFPCFMEIKVEFFNDSLMKLKEGELTIEEVTRNTENHIRDIEGILYVFSTEEERSDKVMLEMDEKLRATNNFFNEHDISHKIVWRIYDSKILNDISIDEIKKMDEPIVFLEQNKLILDETFYTSEFTSDYEYESKPYYIRQSEEVNHLYNAYNIDFVGVGQDGYLNCMYAPAYDLNLKIENRSLSNRFMTLMAQKLLFDQIYEILKSENVENEIGLLVVPNDTGNTDMNYGTYDFSKPIDALDYLNNVYGFDYDVSLISLSTSEEKIDYEILMKLSDKIWNLLDEKDGMSRLSFFIDFYIVKSDEEKSLITSLLYENRLNQRYLDREGGLANIYKNMYIRRLENEAYFYLDIYAEKMWYIIRIASYPHIKSVEEFIEFHKTYKDY
jgi:hypothetical protein